MAINPLEFVRESQVELSKVDWPSRTQTIRLTVVVILISLIVGAYVSGLDTVLTFLTDKLLTLK